MQYLDTTHKYTYSDNFTYIKGTNLSKILQVISSNIVKYLIYQYSKNGFDNINIFKILKNVIIKDNVYKSYNLTDEEISYLNSFDKDKKEICCIKNEICSEINYSKYNVNELRKFVKEKGIKKYSTLKKQELIELLEK